MSPIPGYAADLFDGQRVLVTGAAGGIGRSICSAFRACGAQVLELDLWPEGEMESSRIACDLSDRASIMAVAKRIRAGGALAALVNCAGVFRRVAVAEEAAIEEWDRAFAINLTAPFLLTRALIPVLKGGAVVNVTSVRAETAAAGALAYTASKGGLAALTVALADELAPLGIRVNAVAPGDIDTKMGNADPAIAEELIRRTPMKRMGRPEEIAAACLWLASPLAGFSTGSTIRADGGFLAV